MFLETSESLRSEVVLPGAFVGRSVGLFDSFSIVGNGSERVGVEAIRLGLRSVFSYCGSTWEGKLRSDKMVEVSAKAAGGGRVKVAE